MALPRTVVALTGTLTVLATAALLVLHIILAQALPGPESTARITAILSSALEALVLCLLLWLLSTHLWEPLGEVSRRLNGALFGAGVILCVVAAAVSVAALVCLSNSSTKISSSRLGESAGPFLVGASVTLGLAAGAQLIFLVVHFVVSRMRQHTDGFSLHTREDGRRTPPPHVKSIRYSQTMPLAAKTRGSTSTESKRPPGSSSGRSATETMSSIRTSLSQVVRPITSKTRLLPPGGRRPTSLDSSPYQRSSTPEDGFDTWDTSAVDPHNRRTVLESTPPAPGRLLETIPASPATSRSPSPGTPLDLEPPRTRRRSRSYSPAASRPALQERASFTQPPPPSESHIHPLFRSDSPTPPPAVSPGTVVIAAPHAGTVISDKQSIRSLHRMRSGSLPAVSSPLGQQGGFDDSGRRVDRSGASSLEEEPEEEEEPRGKAFPSAQAERRMTPPVPEWLLRTSSRASVQGQQHHGRQGEGEEENRI